MDADRDPAALFGQDRQRREDRPLLTGQAAYTDDHHPPGTAFLGIHRSRYGHATVGSIETAPAESMDGVLAVVTAADLHATGVDRLPVRGSLLDVEVPGHPVLAGDRVRYQGEPIAAVIATDRYTARDAIGAIEVEYNRRPAVTDPAEAAGPDAPALFEAAPDNVAVARELGDEAATEAAFEAADHTVELTLTNNRLIPNAIEPRAALAEYDAAEDHLTVTMTSQSPHGHRRDLATTLGRPERRIRVIAPDVGGGFGHKGHHHPGESLAAWAAMELERPVKWTATRTENYLAGAHARDHRTDAAIAVDADGRIRGLRVRTDAAAGAYPLGAGPAIAAGYGRLLAGQYDVPAIHCRTRAVFTNTAPVHSYRGAGRPEAIHVTERLVDTAARGLDIGPAALRRRNLIPGDAFPYETPTGAVYDSGDYEPAMDAALDALEAPADPDDGRYRGVGIANYVESTGGGFESGLVRVHPDGGVTVYAGTHSHGQGHGTTYAQLVADELGIDPGAIDVVEGDTDRIPSGTGTFGSRSAIVGGNAVVESATEVAAKARRIAAHRLEADPEDVEMTDGAFHVSGTEERTVAFAEVAATAYGGPLPDGVDHGLEATTFYEPGGTAYTFGTHAVAVAVDPDTGEVEIEQYVAVDDCGPRINPRIVEGQVHGGVAQGIGQALTEHGVYDDNGTLVTGSLQDYAVPKAIDVPEMETDGTVTPSPTNPLGVKGIGEAGTIAAPPAVVNAVVDALAPLGVRHVDMPLSPERVWRAIEAARDA